MVYYKKIKTAMDSNNNYDEVQRDHYNSVASKSGTDSNSTMPDFVIRETESKSICNVIEAYMKGNNISENELKIVDVGCGNGTTLEVLRIKFPTAEITGIEYNHELYKLAKTRTGVEVYEGDLRDKNKLPNKRFNVVLSQRVIINIMNHDDQDLALKNLVQIMEPNGLYIAIEAFESGLKLINTAREELGLPGVPMPHHNLHLKEGFFEISELQRVDLGVPEYFLSTHYYLSYVLYPAIAHANNADFKRDNFMVPFLGKLLPNAGNFGANRFFTFKRA